MCLSGAKALKLSPDPQELEARRACSGRVGSRRRARELAEEARGVSAVTPSWRRRRGARVGGARPAEQLGGAELVVEGRADRRRRGAKVGGATASVREEAWGQTADGDGTRVLERAVGRTTGRQIHARGKYDFVLFR